MARAGWDGSAQNSGGRIDRVVPAFRPAVKLRPLFSAATIISDDRGGCLLLVVLARGAEAPHYPAMPYLRPELSPLEDVLGVQLFQRVLLRRNKRRALREQAVGGAREISS